MTKFAPFIEQLNTFMLETSQSKLKLLNAAVTDLINGGGKRLRPILLHLSAQFGDYQSEKIIETSAGVELLHMATLVHDDIIDDAKLRRGQISAQEKYGKQVAVFIGDYLLSKSYILFSRNLSKHSLNRLNDIVKLICEGEVEQFQNKYRLKITFKDYLRRIRRKTALLFGLCTYIGAYESGIRGNNLYNLYNFGLELGMVFQIQDDLLDFTGDEEKTGKKVGRDMLAGIYTLPVIYLLNDKQYQQQARNILAKKDLQDIDMENISSLIARGKYLERSRELAERFLHKAEKHLEQLPGNEQKNNLRYIIDWQLIRER